MAILPPAVYAASNENKSKQDPQQQSEQIAIYISRLQKSIENNYVARLAELQARQQAAVRLLKVADKDIYALLSERAKVSEVVLHINDYGFDTPWYLQAKTERLLQPKGIIFNRGYPERVKSSARQFAVAESRAEQRKNEILAGFDWAFAQLQIEKEYALSVRLAGLGRQLNKNLAADKPEPKRGIVTGIIYSEDCPVAIVGGKIIHEKDSTDGVTVVKICPDRVEFKKGPRTWSQKVQQSPANYWD